MALDLALGALVLLWAIRGWFKGFVNQTINLASLVGCVFLANPIRDAAKPLARQYLSSMHADLQDRLLWWGGAVVAFVALAGIGGWLVRIRKRQAYGLSEPNRADQGAGFVVGALKGAVAAAFLASAFQAYAPKYVAAGGAVEQYTEASKALSWSNRFKPAERLWNSDAVQVVVAHIKRNGLGDTGEEKAEQEDATSGTSSETAEKHEPQKSTRGDAKAEPVQTARRSSELSIPARKRLDPDSPNIRAELDELIKNLDIRPSKSR